MTRTPLNRALGHFLRAPLLSRDGTELAEAGQMVTGELLERVQQQNLGEELQAAVFGHTRLLSDFPARKAS